MRRSTGTTHPESPKPTPTQRTQPSKPANDGRQTRRATRAKKAPRCDTVQSSDTSTVQKDVTSIKRPPSPAREKASGSSPQPSGRFNRPNPRSLPPNNRHSRPLSKGRPPLIVNQWQQAQSQVLYASASPWNFSNHSDSVATSSRPGDDQSSYDYLSQRDNLSISPELLLARDFNVEFDGGMDGTELFAGIDVNNMGNMRTATPMGMGGKFLNRIALTLSDKTQMDCFPMKCNSFNPSTINLYTLSHYRIWRPPPQPDPSPTPTHHCLPVFPLILHPNHHPHLQPPPPSARLLQIRIPKNKPPSSANATLLQRESIVKSGSIVSLSWRRLWRR